MQARHPSTADGFEWDYEADGNVEHLARRSPAIREWEVEEIFNNRPRWVPNRRKSGDFKMIGRTDDGRELTIIVEWKPSTMTLRAFTGWPCTTGERTRYLRKRT